MLIRRGLRRRPLLDTVQLDRETFFVQLDDNVWPF